MPIAPGAHVQVGGQSEATLTVRIALSRTGILTGNAKQELARTGRVVLRVCSTLFPHCKPSAVGSSHYSFQFSTRYGPDEEDAAPQRTRFYSAET